MRVAALPCAAAQGTSPDRPAKLALQASEHINQLSHGVEGLHELCDLSVVVGLPDWDKLHAHGSKPAISDAN